MNIQSVYDFYYLEALKAKAPAFGNKPQEKLYEDVCKTHDKLVPTLALALYHYLFLACFGEARHARSQCEAWYDDMPQGGERDESYQSALGYDPEGTLKALNVLFHDYNWSGGGYGGGSWGKIVQGAMRYGEWSDVAFIDHVIDLEHNGGNCFDKSEVKYTIDLKIDSSYMSTFLDYKAGYDLLSEFEDWLDDYVTYWTITNKTQSLLHRYYKTRKLDIPIELNDLATVPSSQHWTYDEPTFGAEVPTDLVLRKDVIYDSEEEEEHLPINRIYHRYLNAVNHLPVYPIKRELCVG